MSVVIAGVARRASRRMGLPPRELARLVVEAALVDASVQLGRPCGMQHIQAVFASPSFCGAVPAPAFSSAPVAASPFLGAHGIATHLGLFDGSGRSPLCRTGDTGGASPVSLLRDAVALLGKQSLLLDARNAGVQGSGLVVVVCADVLGSLSAQQVNAVYGRGVLQEAGSEIAGAGGWGDCSEETIASIGPRALVMEAYDALASWWIDSGRGTREDLAAVSALMSLQAEGLSKDAGGLSHCPRLVSDAAAGRAPETLIAEVLGSRRVAGRTTIRECARLVDGAAAVVLAIDDPGTDGKGRSSGGGDVRTGVVRPLGFGEASARLSALSYPLDAGRITEASVLGPLRAAMAEAMAEAGERSAREIQSGAQSGSHFDFASVYDCFPVTFLLGIEAFGIARPGQAGEWVKEALGRAVAGDPVGVNTHGGLLAPRGFGAPGDVPAMFGLVEAVLRTRGTPGLRSLVHANGGVLSHTAVAVLESQ